MTTGFRASSVFTALFLVFLGLGLATTLTQALADPPIEPSQCIGECCCANSTCTKVVNPDPFSCYGNHDCETEQDCKFNCWCDDLIDLGECYCKNSYA
jgi:hypothetical protein